MDIFNFKCKYCGGEMGEVEGLKSVGKCKYCGSKQTLPKLHDEKRANLFERANHLRRNNEFDKAEALYEQILNDDLTDPEAYWSLVLCRYGVEYVEDARTKARIPTVNRTQMTSIFGDEDYKSAIKNADAEQKALYEEEAKIINEIQKGILEISQKEAPFDIFICYKETDASGKRSRDSVLAQDLYHELTRDGYKVFFARVTLQGKLGSAYEPYIFSALNSAKVMVVLGTQKEHFEAVWVRNEWSRFLGQIKKGERKVLIPAYRDMDAYDLPPEFSNLQALDMDRLGFMQELVQGIESILSAYKKKPSYEKSEQAKEVPSMTKEESAAKQDPASEKKKPKKKKKAAPIIIISLLLVAAIVTGVLVSSGIIPLPFGNEEETTLSPEVTDPAETDPTDGQGDSKLSFSKMGDAYYVSGIGSETSKRIAIPSTYKGLAVINIGYGAFSGCDEITEVIIPDSVNSIGSCAFENCTALMRVVIPDSVTKISSNAFKNCTSLTTIVYDGTEADWNGITFESDWNSGMTEYTIDCTDNDIVVGGGVAENGAFEEGVEYRVYIDQKASGKKLYLTGTMDTYFLVGSENVGDAASVYFERASEDEYYMYFLIDDEPYYVNIMEEPGENDVYLNIALSTTRSSLWTWSDTVKSVVTVFNGHELFIATKPDNASYTNASCLRTDAYGSSAYALNFEKASGGTSSDLAAEGTWGTNATYTLTNDGILTFSGEGLLDRPDGDANAENPWENVQSKARSGIDTVKIKKIVVNSGITGIGAFLFYGLYDLEIVEFADSVEYIYASAFEGSSLSSIKADGVKMVFDHAFAGCKKLESLSLPELTSVDVDAFNGCKGLKTVVLPKATTLKTGAFSECDSLNLVDLPSIITVEANAFAKSEGLTTLYLGYGLTHIGANAFENCTDVSINFAGTSSQWDAVSKNDDWNEFLDDSKMQFESSSSGTNVGDDLSDAVQGIEEHTAYKAVIYQGNVGRRFYLNGNLVTNTGTYLDTTDIKSNAQSVYFEVSGRGFHMYFIINGVRKYINIGEDPSTGNRLPAIDDIGHTVWYWDSSAEYLYGYDGSIAYFLGTNSSTEYTNVSLNSIDLSDNYFKLFLIIDDSATDEPETEKETETETEKETETETETETVTDYSDPNKIEGSFKSGVAYNMVFYHTNLAAKYYLNGSMTRDGYYLDASTNSDSAANLYVEELGLGDYYLYFNIDGIKYYINIVYSDTGHYNPALEREGVTPWCWDVNNHCLVGNFNGAGFFLGTIKTGTYENIAVVSDSSKDPENYCNVYLVPSVKGSEDDDPAVDVNGTVGDLTINVKDGVLTISGSGEMIELDSYPWSGENITEIYIDNGVTSVAGGAFQNMTTLKTVSFPATLKKIGKNAFYGCSALTSATFDDNSGLLYNGKTLNLSEPSKNAGWLKNTYVLMDWNITFVDPDAITRIEYEVPYFGVVYQGNLGKKYYLNGQLLSSEMGTFFDTTENIFEACPIYFEEPRTNSGYNPAVYFLINGTKQYLAVESDGPAFWGSGGTKWSWDAERSCLTTTVNGEKFLGISDTSLDSKVGLYSTDIADTAFKMYFVIGSENGSGSGDTTVSETVTLNGVVYTFDKGTETYSATGFSNPSGKITILSSVNGYPVTEIAERAFYSCETITYVEIEYGIEKLCEYAFWGCHKLETIIIPDSVQIIEREMFADCFVLTSVTIPDGVPSIGDSAFYNCRKMTTLIVPTSVTSIGSNAMWGCSGLESITYLGTEQQWNAIDKDPVWADNFDESKVSFSGGSGSSGETVEGELEISGVDEIYKLAYKIDENGTLYVSVSGNHSIPSADNMSYPWQNSSYSITSLVIADGVTAIGSGAFSKLTALRSVTVPSSVVIILSNAFESCPSLASVEFASGATATAHLTDQNGEENTVEMNLDTPETNAIWLRDTYCMAEWTISYTENDVECNATGGAHDYSNLNYDQESHWYECACGLRKDISAHSLTSNGVCVTCKIVIEVETEPGETGSITENGITYTFDPNSNSYTVTDFDGSVTRVDIVDEHNGIPVTKIGADAFRAETDLRTVTIPASITEIGENAFNNCTTLSTIRLASDSQLRSIGSYAFFGSKVSSLDLKLAKGLTNIGEWAFAHSNLSRLEITTSNDLYIGNEAFSSCSRLTTVIINSNKITLGSGAFYPCDKLSRVTVSGEVINDPLNDGSSYFGIALYEINVHASVLPFIELDQTTDLNTVTISGGTVRDMGENESISTLILGDGVTEIEDHAFSNWKRLNTVTMGANVTRIGTDAFVGTVIENLQFTSTPVVMKAMSSDGVMKHHITEFSNGLTTAEALSSRAYAGCYWIISYSADDLPPAGDDTEPPVSGDTPAAEVTQDGIVYKLTSNSSTGENYYTITNGKGASGAVTIPAQINGVNVTGIALAAFEGNGNITDVTFDCEYLTYIGFRAFCNCGNLNTVNMSNAKQLKCLPTEMFQYCSSLTKVTLPDSINEMGSLVFNGCSSLSYNYYDNAGYIGSAANQYIILMDGASIGKINDNTKLIYAGALSNCPESKFTTVTENGSNIYYLGSSTNAYYVLVRADYGITSCSVNKNTKIICDRAFEGRSSLSSITLPEGLLSIGEYAFHSCGSLSSIQIPSTVCSLGMEMFPNCPLTSITIPEGVSYLGHSLLYGCGSLTSVTLPDNLTCIGANVFDGCAISTLSLPSTVRFIDGGSLSDCWGLQTIMYNGTMEQWNAIEKIDIYGFYNVVCTDGEIQIGDGW